MRHVAVLSGGGAKGCYQAGRLCARIKKGDRYDAIVGTSVGALNAFGLSRLGHDGVRDLWLSIKGMGDVAKKSWLNFLFSDGLHDMSPLRERLAAIEADTTVDVPYFACFMDLRDFAIHYGSDLDAVMASASISGIHKPVNKWFVDGGHREHTPIKYAIKTLKADEVSVFVTYPPKETVDEKWEPTFPKMYSYAMRGVDALSHDVAWNDIVVTRLKNKIHGFKTVKMNVYAPAKPILLKTMEFDPVKLRHYFNAGYSEEMSR